MYLFSFILLKIIIIILGLEKIFLLFFNVLLTEHFVQYHVAICYTNFRDCYTILNCCTLVTNQFMLIAYQDAILTLSYFCLIQM